VTNAELEAWLETYGRAWETKDPELVSTLFASDGLYFETASGEPVRGREGIHAYWIAATRNQTDIRFTSEVVAIDGNVGVARWKTVFLRVPSGTRVRLDGIFVLTFDQASLCRDLHEWWHRSDPGRSGPPAEQS
jgi:uncharacterized protein (TIGR02246 family)